ncbi:protease [Lithospermum erythrorhizon]|uniref:Protease n=1 Tax=Lithospermum erythrorhizon TaxID=34254 RepID=A0AAV3PI32_LITER
MGVEYLRQFKPFVKEAFQQTLRVGKFLCCIHVTNTYLCTFTYAWGPSMLPTLNLTGTLLLAERVSTLLGKAGPGDVVLVRSPENSRKFITKRIIAKEGDTVTYLVNPKEGDQEKTLIVPKGHIWIEGDNKYNTSDSRNFGPVPYGLLEGRLFWKVWPLKEFGSLD